MKNIHKRHFLRTAAITLAGIGGTAQAAPESRGSANGEGQGRGQAAFVLVHGGWHGAWCYERVIPLLAAQGHRAIARDLPGHGLNARFPVSYQSGASAAVFAAEPSPLAGVTLDDYADSVIASIDMLRAAGHDKVVLVGHSAGGIVLNAVGERVPNKLDALVYLAANMPGSGIPVGVYFGLPENASALVNPLMVGDPFAIGAFRIGPRRTDAGYRTALRQAFYNDATEADFEAAASLLGTELPLKPMVTPILLSPERWGSIERHYIVCQQDHSVPVALAHRFIADVDALTRRRATVVHSLDTGHSAFVTAPKELARLLLDIARNPRT